ncbi:MAG: DUF3341 domain-containing protein [Verrucomicrobiae bacterium]|nr:DUF3341 domain-containing protein [Verrucomicrobiae bacterium]
MNAPESKVLYAVGAQFKSVADLYHAAEKIRDSGFKRWDVHSPFPIHGMDDAMGINRSWVSFFSLVGGAIGFCTAVALQVYTSVIEYPLITNGKPFFSLPAFFPVMFELTILITAFMTLFGLFGLSMLPQFHHPVFNWDLFCEKANDDGFFIVIEARDRIFNESKTKQLLEEIGGTNITPIYY